MSSNITLEHHIIIIMSDEKNKM